ncbi:MAG TPA: hypothetical protein VLV83_12555 [Acidobacteriota bacterium]|nr:hypothetical protein [Acidobacteriota bacterium]
MSSAATSSKAGRAGLSEVDLKLIGALEDLTLSPEDFGHVNHVRAAWTYLSRLPLDRALVRFRETLKRFAKHIGKPDLYHETITAAYFYLIHERMQGYEDESWQAFRRRNPDLLRWKGGLLERLYSPRRLQSELARRHFILPDVTLGSGKSRERSDTGA